MGLAAELDACDEEFAEKLDALLRCFPDVPSLCVGSPSGWEIVEFVPSGDPGQRSAGSGPAKGARNFPARRPERRAHKPTLEEFFADKAFQAAPEGYVSYRQERDRETEATLSPFREHLNDLENALVTEVLAAATSAPALRVSDRHSCANCRGVGQFSRVPCWCITRGAVSQGTEDVPGPDPECSECGGSGVSAACPVCAGSGVLPVVLNVHVDGSDGAAFSFRMDVASLVRHGHAQVSAFTRLGAGGRFFEVVLRVSFGPLLELVSTAVCSGDPVQVLWGPWRAWEAGVEVSALSVMPDPASPGLALTGVTAAETSTMPRPALVPVEVDVARAARAALGAAQDKAVFGAVSGAVRADPTVAPLLAADGSRVGVRVHATRRVAAAVMLADLVTRASACGLRVGLSSRPGDSPEMGAGVYLLSDAHEHVSQLAIAPSWRVALAQALRRLPSVGSSAELPPARLGHS